ncbi:MAG TPA: hypothetical protein VNF68_01835, partial [Candidatus Baltobacteraceae bacterium]|nr:hypothetical protein [Candidatus Baltobacteraceae bacterium]
MLLALILAASLDAPPANLVPSTARLGDVLRKHTDSTGNAIVEDWSFTDTGVSGTEHLERSGTNYFSRIVTGDLVERFGQIDGKRWHQDYNGITTSTSQVEDRSFLGILVNE